MDQKKIELSLELEKIEPVKLDQMLLREMLYNLVLNAVSYTPNSGRITVRVADLTNELLIEVKDTGIGIPLSEQNKIFEKFYRASNAIDTQSDGSGLGLYLVKLIVDAFNGSIGFSSTPGVGSTFSIKIPKKGVVTKTGEVSLTSQIGQLKASDKSVKSHH
jgi:two-component system phosphate regulon sensor histidine kinase PhoR